MQQQIKIISFEREDVKNQQPQKSPFKSGLSINFIVFSPNKKLGFVQKFIKSKQKERDDIGYTKCIKNSALNYALDNCEVGIPVLCIFDKQIDEQMTKLFLENHKTVENRNYFSLALFIQGFQAISSQYYHIEGLNLITSSQQKLIEFIEKILYKKKTLNSIISTSSLNSNDFNQVQHQFDVAAKINQPIVKEQTDNNKQTQLMYGQQSPGYKNNKIDQQKPNKVANFSNGKKISDPQQWQNTQKTFSRMQR